MSTKLAEKEVIKLREIISGTRTTPRLLVDEAGEWTLVNWLTHRLKCYALLRPVIVPDKPLGLESIEVDLVLAEHVIFSTLARLDTSVIESLGDYKIESDGEVREHMKGQRSFSGVQFDKGRVVSFVRLLIAHAPDRK
ncbi:hypothetical protein KBD71_03230 [Candidatus Woesebacteria bacterium]|nr:hypothetical protein [Candidatus Woesebacteria bacterium]